MVGENNNTILIKSENNGLVIYNEQTGFKAKLHFITDSDFFLIEHPGSEFKFTKDIHNKVNGFTQKKGNKIFNITKIE